MYAACLLWGAVLQPTASLDVTRLDVADEVQAARIVLTWTTAVTTTAEIDGREIYLAFDRPLGDLDADAIRTGLPGWVEWIQSGHSSLLIHAARDVAYEVQPWPTGVEVHLHAVRTDPVAAADAGSDGITAAEKRLQCLRGAALIAAWDLESAERLLGDLLSRDPDHLDAVLLLAETAARQEQWRRAVDHYDRALDLVAPNPDVSQARTRLWHAHGNGLQYETYLRDVSNVERQYVSTLQGRLLSLDEVTVSARLWRLGVELDAMMRSDGRVSPYDEQNVYGDLRAEWRGTGIERNRARLHLGPGGVGLGGSHRWGRPVAATEISLDFGEPHLEHLQGIADEGVRDRLSVIHQRRMRERWTLTLGLSGNRYGLAGLDEAARSFGFRGVAGYALTRRDPVVYAEYVLDIETYSGLATRRDAAGLAFRPLPLVDRRTHSLGGSAGHALSPVLYGTALFGYSYDPRNGHGTYGGVDLSYDPAARLALSVRASLGLNTQRSDSARFRQVGTTLRWSF